MTTATMDTPSLGDPPRHNFDPIPAGFYTKFHYPIHPFVISAPFIKTNYTYTKAEASIDDDINFNVGRFLSFPSMFSPNAHDSARRIHVDPTTPLARSLDVYRDLVSTTPMLHQSSRTLLQNCSRMILFLHRAWKAELISGDTLENLAGRLACIFEETKTVMQSVSRDQKSGNVPDSFLAVATAQWEWVSDTKLAPYYGCSFKPARYDRLLWIPVVLHPALDLSMETLQLSLNLLMVTHYSKITGAAVYVQCVYALGAVNRSLFLNPDLVADKARAFMNVLTEFRRLHTRARRLDSKVISRWLISTLLTPKWQEDFQELCGYLKECVERISGESFNIDDTDIEDSIRSDTSFLDEDWLENLAIAEQDRCTNVDTCEALKDFPQWFRLLIHETKDVEGAKYAAKRACKLLQATRPGSYGYRTLVFALYEIRRNLYDSLREWEFFEHEVNVLSPLGQGGFATVHLCEWLGRPAAIKVFRVNSPSPAMSTLTNQHLDSYLHQREMETWFRLSHPHILPFLGACTTSATPMILTPLASSTARTYRATHPGANWTKLLTQISSGVHYLHHHAAIIHGDLKGVNILIDFTGSPLISDFGLAKMVQNVYGRVNRWGGTAHWMAPELFGKTEGLLTYATDIYALGMSFYELWYGKNPFDYLEGDLVEEIVVEEGLRPSREGEEPEIPDNLWRLLERCWSADPSVRPLAMDVCQNMVKINGSDPGIDFLARPVTSTKEKPAAGDNEDTVKNSTSIENLVCTPLHHPPLSIKRPDFPFPSSGHLISFARSRFARYDIQHIRHRHLETTADSIRSCVIHPVEMLIFRIQSQTTRKSNKPQGIPWYYGEDKLAYPSRFEAVLLRHSQTVGTEGGKWSEVPDIVEVVLENHPACNTSVTHEVRLGPDSAISRNAEAGDKVVLCVMLDTNWGTEVLSVEIEMHVRLGIEDIQRSS